MVRILTKYCVKKAHVFLYTKEKEQATAPIQKAAIHKALINNHYNKQFGTPTHKHQ